MKKIILLIGLAGLTALAGVRYQVECPCGHVNVGAPVRVGVAYGAATNGVRSVTVKRIFACGECGMEVGTTTTRRVREPVVTLPVDEGATAALRSRPSEVRVKR